MDHAAGMTACCAGSCVMRINFAGAGSRVMRVDFVGAFNTPSLLIGLSLRRICGGVS